MVSRLLSLLTLFPFILIASMNQLELMQIKHNILELHFIKPLTRSEIRTEAIRGKEKTKYIFDFKNCYLGSRVKSLKNSNKIVFAVRAGQYKPNVVRVVLDSKRPFSLHYYQKKRPIFYIKLPLTHQAGKRVHKSSVKELFSNVDISKEKTASKSEQRVLLNSRLKHNYTIILDPGHGGNDVGTMWGGVKESTVVLQIAKRVYRKLKTLGFRVILTRSSNKTTKLHLRSRFANRKSGDLFISIHGNSVGQKSRANVVHGIETYFLMPAKDARAKRVAARENRQLLAGEDLATRRTFINVVFTGPKIELSKRLAIDIQRNIIASLRSSYDYIKDGGAKGANYYVLAGAQMPAVLIETGYISNPKERARLLDPNYQDKLADGIVKGIIRYFKNRERELD